MMAGKTWGFGIVGWGTISPFHAAAIAALPNAKLVAVQTSKPEKATTISAMVGPGVAICPTIEELVSRPDVDIINICTPSGHHLEPALRAAQSGKHVVVEKPLEITLQRCDQIIQACAVKQVKLCTIFPSRFSDVNLELKRAITAGRFGKITLADTTVKWWRPQSYYDNGGWRGTWNLDGGGALMNQAIHNVDLLQWLVGPVRRISAFTACLAHERIEVEDTAVAILQFASGAIGVIEAATSAYPGLLKTVGVHGNGGSVIIEQDHLLTWNFLEEQPEDSTRRERFTKSSSTGGASDPKAISFEGHRRQLADLLLAIEENRPAAVDGNEGRHAVEIILAIYQSQREGRPVALS